MNFHSVPAKQVNLLIHVVRDGNGDQNFQDSPTDIAKLNSIVAGVNNLYSNLSPQSPLGVCNPPSVQMTDSKISFIISGIKFYNSEEFFCTDTRADHDELFEEFVTNNSNLTQSEKSNNLHAIIVAYRGGGTCRCECDNPVKVLGGSGIRGNDYCALRGYYDTSNITAIAGHMSHELGHTLGLWHSWQDGFEGVCDTGGGQFQSNNIMDYTNYQAFTQRQIAKMHYWIENREGGTQPYLANNLCQKQTSEITIPSGMDIHWDTDEIVSEDVHIYGKLTLTCTVEVANDVRFVVHEGGKLVVDGAIVTSCDTSWKGIQVYGGSSDYAVEVINNSAIENTSVAAISMFHHHGWLLGDGNAHIYIDNSTFNNCKRVLAMAARQPSYNTTIVNNSTHNGGKWSITNWNCYNVEITNNEFNDISNECIVTEVGQFRIEGNTFNSGRADILFANVNPGYGTFIEDNQFNGANTGVRALGTTFGQHNIRYNQFWTGEFDLFMDGDNNYLIEHNDITADFGGVFADNGNHSNEVFYNQVQGNFVGLMPLGSNGNYLFYNNCFNTSYADNYIEGQVSSVQAGSGFDPANNCFTHQGNANHPTYDMTGNPDPFIYVEPDNDPRNCLNAEKAHPNIIREFGGPDLSNPCGEAGSGNVIPPQYNPCNPKKSIKDTQIAISWLQNKILEIQNNPNLTDKQKQRYIAFYRRCLKRVQWWWCQVMFEAERHEEVREYFESDTTRDAKLVIYTSYIYQYDLDAAHQYLASLSEPDEQLSDFVTIQLINLQRLRNGNVYEASGSELSTVEAIARKRHPYAGYAKALYYWLTGEIISTELPEIFKDHQVTPRSLQSKVTVDEIGIYPNPFSNLLTVKYRGKESVNVMIVDLFGREMYNKAIDNSTEINTSRWNSGMYLLTIRSNDEIIRQEKLMLIH